MENEIPGCCVCCVDTDRHCETCGNLLCDKAECNQEHALLCWEPSAILLDQNLVWKKIEELQREVQSAEAEIDQFWMAFDKKAIVDTNADLTCGALAWTLTTMGSEFARKQFGDGALAEFGRYASGMVASMHHARGLHRTIAALEERYPRKPKTESGE